MSYLAVSLWRLFPMDEGAEGKLGAKHKVTCNPLSLYGEDLCDILQALLAALKLREEKQMVNVQRSQSCGR